MLKNEADLKRFLTNLNKEDIHFTKHFYEKQEFDRKYLSEELLIKSLKNINNFLGFQDQSKDVAEKYRIGIKLSEKYNLVIICEVRNKSLYIITSWMTNRKWQKAIQK